MGKQNAKDFLDYFSGLRSDVTASDDGGTKIMSLVGDKVDLVFKLYDLADSLHKQNKALRKALVKIPLVGRTEDCEFCKTKNRKAQRGLTEANKVDSDASFEGYEEDDQQFWDL